METFEQYEDAVATRIQGLRTERDALEKAADVADIESTEAVRIDRRLKAVSENLALLEALAFHIVAQQDTIARLTEEVNALRTRVSALRELNTRAQIRHDSARAVAALHQSKWQHFNRATDAWLSEKLSSEELVIIQNL